MSFYTILNVDEETPQAGIREAYLELAQEHHPDLNPESSEASLQFKVILRAYEVLSDPHQRRQYDVDPSRFETELDQRGNQHSCRDGQDSVWITPTATSYALRRSSRNRGLRRVLPAILPLCLAGLVVLIVQSGRTPGPDDNVDRNAKPFAASAEDDRHGLITRAKPLGGPAEEAGSIPPTVPRPLLLGRAVPIAEYETNGEDDSPDTQHVATIGLGSAATAASPVINSNYESPGTVRPTGFVELIGDSIDPLGIGATTTVRSPLVPLGRGQGEGVENTSVVDALILTDNSSVDAVPQSNMLWLQDGNVDHGSSGLSVQSPSTTRLPPVDLSTRQPWEFTQPTLISNMPSSSAWDTRLYDQELARRSTRFPVPDAGPTKEELTRARYGTRRDVSQIGRDKARRQMNAQAALPPHPVAWKSEPVTTRSPAFDAWHPLAQASPPASSVDSATYRPGGAGLPAAMGLGQRGPTQVAVWSSAGWKHQSWGDRNRTSENLNFGLGTAGPYADLPLPGTQDAYGTPLSGYRPIGTGSTGAIPAASPRPVPAYGSGPPSAWSWSTRQPAYR